ncbi:hypothetical protein J6590_075913 [Homalodisca vitripennis]|nr:hypothetical protein J6590_075913 [Homalodisca vitripennis]
MDGRAVRADLIQDSDLDGLCIINLRIISESQSVAVSYNSIVNSICGQLLSLCLSSKSLQTLDTRLFFALLRGPYILFMKTLGTLQPRLLSA